MNNDELATVIEALDDMKQWKPLYEKLLKICRTKEEAIEALKYTMKLANEIKTRSPNE